MAILVPCLVALRDEFNELSPNRDKSTDGWIGDSSHSSGSSDHNPDESGNTPYEDSDNIDEVHAIDVDKDLKLSDTNMQDCVDVIVGRHKRGEDHRLQYVIYNRKIWSRSWGWTADDYTGSNPHDEHAHFSARYETENESDTSPWGLLEDLDMADAYVTGFNDSAKDAMQKEATDGVLSYKGGGLASWTGQPANRNFLNMMTEMFNMIVELQKSVEELRGS